MNRDDESSMVQSGTGQPDLPRVDECVVEPETREEMIDGRIVHKPPASPPKAELHSRLNYILHPHAAAGYVASTHLLTRTSEKWNFAADTSIRKQGIDPSTGSRYLEELAFEIKHEKSFDDLDARVRQLAGRGVRRVFTICLHTRQDRGEDILVATGPVMEWMPGEDRWHEGHWVELAADARIEDPALCCPLPVQALLDRTKADKAVFRALLAQGNPVLVKAVEEAKERVLRQYILDMCDILAIELTPARRAHIEALDAEGLVALRDHLETHRRWDD